MQTLPWGAMKDFAILAMLHCCNIKTAFASGRVTLASKVLVREPVSFGRCDKQSREDLLHVAGRRL